VDFSTGKGDYGRPLLIEDGGYFKQDALASRYAWIYRSFDNKRFFVSIYDELSVDDFKQWIQTTTNEKVNYTCQVKQEWDDVYWYKYVLEFCKADGDWSNVAPYLVKEPPQNVCAYFVYFNQWLCDAPNTPIYNYTKHFSIPNEKSGKIFEAKAAVPLTELGN
jgi:hypothetical protein